MLKDKIKADMISAMKQKNVKVRDTLRLVQSAIKQIEVDEQKTLDDADVINVITKMVKQRHDSIKQYDAGGRKDLADIERCEIEVINVYLPQVMTEEEQRTYIDCLFEEIKPASMKDMGKVMGALNKPELSGRMDKGFCSTYIRSKLQ